MTEEVHFKNEKIVSMDPKILLEKLNFYFGHSNFKSSLQKDAIIEILKRTCIFMLSPLLLLLLC